MPVSDTHSITSPASPTPAWGSPAIVFVIGLASLVVLGGTRFAPVVIAFLVAVMVYWALPTS